MPNKIEYKDKAMTGSNFERREKDQYQTEPWVTRALIKSLDELGWISFKWVWEPACGKGYMSRVLEKQWYTLSSDIDIGQFKPNEQHENYQFDFFEVKDKPIKEIDAIITNPPYNVAELFIYHALRFDVKLVAMLLRHEYDCAKLRNMLFTEEIHGKKFAAKITLTSRPRWDRFWEKERPDKSPRHPYAWYVWLKDYEKLPIIRYAQKT